MQIRTKTLYLLDRNVISIIKDSVAGIPQADKSKLHMLQRLRNLDRPRSSVSCILSLIEGQKGREESYDEKLLCLRKETEIIKSFFELAATDADTLLSTQEDFAKIFSSHIESEWNASEAFLIDACLLLKDKVPANKLDSVRMQLIQNARDRNLNLGHIIVILCLSCLYGNDAARGVLKPHISPLSSYNALNDAFTLSRIALIRGAAERNNFSWLNITFITLDKSLTNFFTSLSLVSTESTEDGVRITLRYNPNLFPRLNENAAIELLNELNRG